MSSEKGSSLLCSGNVSAISSTKTELGLIVLVSSFEKLAAIPTTRKNPPTVNMINANKLAKQDLKKFFMVK
jgi:hypothetical protein